jgi:cyanophycin synthetase
MALDFNQSLFHKELKSRGVRVRAIDETPLFSATRGKTRELLYDVAISSTTFAAGWIASDKVLTKILLLHSGIPVPEGSFFTQATKDEAISYAEKIGFPVVLKPTIGTHGDSVFPFIESADELRNKIALFEREKIGNGYYLIEKHFQAEEYRIFTTINGYIAVVHRTPACVVGDGKNTVLGLIQIENYKRMNPRTTCLCEIKLDPVFFDTLEKKRISLDAIVPKGKKIILRPSSNVSMGGSCEACTAEAHPSVKKLAMKVFQAIPGLTIVGIDLLCSDIKKSLDKQRYGICELNTSAGLSLHALPAKGKSDNVAAKLTDLIFPKQ